MNHVLLQRPTLTKVACSVLSLRPAEHVPEPPLPPDPEPLPDPGQMPWGMVETQSFGSVINVPPVYAEVHHEMPWEMPGDESTGDVDNPE